jgi:hypothetical protein
VQVNQPIEYSSGTRQGAPWPRFDGHDGEVPAHAAGRGQLHAGRVHQHPRAGGGQQAAPSPYPLEAVVTGLDAVGEAAPLVDGKTSVGPSGSLESRTAAAALRSAISTHLPLPPLEVLFRQSARARSVSGSPRSFLIVVTPTPHRPQKIRARLLQVLVHPTGKVHTGRRPSCSPFPRSNSHLD